jgi:hypothetical protein
MWPARRCARLPRPSSALATAPTEGGGLIRIGVVPASVDLQMGGVIEAE